MLTRGHLTSRHPVVVRGGLVLGRVGGRRRGRLPVAARHRQHGVAQRSCTGAGPLPRAGAQLDVRISAGGLPLRGAHARLSAGRRPHAVAAHHGSSLVDARRRLCAGFRQFGLFVEVCNVDYVLSIGGWLVLVRGCGACHAVGGSLRSGATLVDVCLDIVPLPTCSSSQTVWLVVSWVGILLDVATSCSK